MNYEYPTTQDKIKRIFYSVYSWMTAALILTGITAYVVAHNKPLFSVILAHRWVSLTLFLVQLIVVIVFVGLLSRLSYAMALFLFFLYSVLSGITLSVIFFTYDLSSIIQALFITAGMFISMALYGYLTGADLSKMGSILRMALWGMILALLINIFIKSSTLSLLFSIVGVVLFSALTAYDVYTIKQLASRLEGADSESYAKIGVLGALQLYLDFINLFLSLLNITGKQRE